jgi:hypothetical protein
MDSPRRKFWLSQRALSTTDQLPSAFRVNRLRRDSRAARQQTPRAAQKQLSNNRLTSSDPVGAAW